MIIVSEKQTEDGQKLWGRYKKKDIYLEDEYQNEEAWRR